MRLLYLSKIETNRGWGAETFLNKALTTSGVETICLDYQKNRYHLAKRLIKLDSNFDACLLQRGTGYLLPISILHAMKCPRILLFTELVARYPSQHYLLESGLFDHVFVRSRPCIEYVIERGWVTSEQVSLMLSGVDVDFFRPLQDIEKDIDILFVGTPTARRQEILAALQQHFSIIQTRAFGLELVNLINRAKIVLNIHAADQPDTETRVYEVLACRGFLLTEWLSSENPFTNGAHLVEARDLPHMQELLRHYLAHPALRQGIADAGYQEVVQRHTVLERARQLKRVLDKVVAAAGSHDGAAFDHRRLRQARRQERLLHLHDLVIRRPRYALGRWRQHARLFFSGDR